MFVRRGKGSTRASAHRVAMNMFDLIQISTPGAWLQKNGVIQRLALGALLCQIASCSSSDAKTSPQVPGAAASSGGGVDASSASGTKPGETQGSKSEEDSGETGSTQEPGGVKFDFGLPEEPKKEGDIPDCDEVVHHPCDSLSDDPLHAMGINCPGEEPQIQASFVGVDASRGVRQSLGNTKTFNPREGSKYFVLGTGNVAELGEETPEGDQDLHPKFCNDFLSKEGRIGHELPPPMKVNRVGSVDCAANPALVGTGDCSNSIQAQWDAARSPSSTANDYAELRLKIKVPLWAKSLSYDFAFSTVEYPAYYGRKFNDLFIAWLESKRWTGNVSFDEQGNPISLNAGFLNYRDAEKGTPNDPECEQGCSAPELHGSCLKQHAGTKWLRTTFGVTPGEEILLIFAIMDMHDPILDSFVFLDNFRWGCEDEGKPKTDPPQ